MAQSTKRELGRLRAEFISGLVSYMNHDTDEESEPDFDAGYTQVHITRCAKIVDEMLAAFEVVRGQNKAIMKVVKTAVIKLNKLNDRCDGTLLETDQREQLCAIIIAAAKRAGLESTQHDITEEWREW